MVFCMGVIIVRDKHPEMVFFQPGETSHLKNQEKNPELKNKLALVVSRKYINSTRRYTFRSTEVFITLHIGGYPFRKGVAPEGAEYFIYECPQI